MSYLQQYRFLLRLNYFINFFPSNQKAFSTIFLYVYISDFYYVTSNLLLIPHHPKDILQISLHYYSTPTFSDKKYSMKANAASAHYLRK